MYSMAQDVIKIGDYIVIQKQSFKKLHKLNKSNSCINLGKDNINLSAIEGCPYSSIFRLITRSNNKKKREYELELADEIIGLRDEINVKVSGTDNRNIVDDGFSQKLTADEIEELKSDSNKASDIIESLISNSNTFNSKTEFSQEKYLRKKEKKYFDFLQILKPNLRIVSEIMFKLDASKILGLRNDTLSQIITIANVNSDGNYLLYDSGSNGLLAAALLTAIGPCTKGKLVHMHPGNMSQKQALLAMNLNEEHYNRCISVNVYSALRQYYQGSDTNLKSLDTYHSIQSKETLKRKLSEDNDLKRKIPKLETTEDILIEDDLKQEPKKPKWHFDNIFASELLHNKVDSLVIACKEDPQNLFKELVTFVKPGRPFVIYYSVAEPLQNLYLSLRSHGNVAALKLTCNWMRNFQILPDRTHPEVLMNAASGFLLTGYVLK